MAQINKPTDYFNTVLYSGNGGTQEISTGLKPEIVFIKGRNTATRYPSFFDIVRGATKRLITSSAYLEDTHTTMLNTFGSTSWTTGGDDQTNGSGETYVSWNWLAGGTPVSNTDGSITSSVSANTTSGVSIVSYTGTGAAATVGHGLGSVPKVMFVKNRPISDNWPIYTSTTGNGTKLRLNGSNSQITSVDTWNNTTPTSSVFSLGTDSEANNSSTAHIAYCFAEKKGFSKFGSYTGNASTDGPFVYTGFKPAWLLVKRTDGEVNWKLLDNKRDPYNDGTGANVNLNDADAEDDNAAYTVDFLSNGFKIKNSNANFNASAGTFFYMAFAENPVVGTNNIPATAR